MLLVDDFSWLSITGIRVTSAMQQKMLHVPGRLFRNVECVF